MGAKVYILLRRKQKNPIKQTKKSKILHDCDGLWFSSKYIQNKFDILIKSITSPKSVYRTH